MTATTRVAIPADTWVLVADGLANVTIQKLEVYKVEVVVAQAAPSNSEFNIGHVLYEDEPIYERNGLGSTDQVYVRAAPGESTEVSVTAGAGASSGGGGASGDIGSATDAVAPTDGTGNYGVISALKRLLLNSVAFLSRTNTLGQKTAAGSMPVVLPSDQSVVATNITSKILSSCENYPDAFWSEDTLSPGDIILARGNTSGAGWIEISKDPFSADSETVLSVAEGIEMPVRISLMDSVTHRNAGESIAGFEFISDDAADGLALLDAPEPIEILNASQATTTITLNFAAAPTKPLRVGQVVSVYGFVDTRLNVNSATVASVVNDLQVTLVGNDYTFTSTTIASTPGNGAAFIERVDMLGRARNGVSYVHSNGTSTNRRVYTRSQGGVARPSGTLGGGHNITTGTDAATAAANLFRAESFLAPTETMFMVSRDGVFISDRSPDANGGLTQRFRSSQIVPNPARSYKMRFRVRSTPSLTRPIAKIVSISKSGSTTATIITDAPHGLTTGQYAGFYGVNNQTAFANLTLGAMCTVIDPVTFTLTHGSSATATSYGGFVTRLQGQQTLGGAIAQVAQSVSRTGNIVTVVGNANWAAPAAIGNIVELIGFKDTATGADLGLDGAYNVINISTTSLVLDPVANHAPTGGDITSVNCGGGVVQRFGYRIHRLMAIDYDPFLMEPAFKGNSDGGEALAINGTVSATQSGTWTAGQGAVAALGTNNAGSWPVRQAAVRTADIASGAITSTQTSAAIDVSANNGAQQFTLDVTAVSGTNPRCYFRVQESFDGGANYVTVFDLPPAINSTDKTHATPVLPVLGTHCRYIRALSGTSPSFTNSVTRTERTGEVARTRRQLVDRTVSLLATTPSTDLLYIDGCTEGQIVLVLGAATAAPTLKLQVCDDVSNGGWYDVPGATVAGTAASTVASAIFNLPPAKFARLVPTVAGSVITADTYTLIVKAWN